MIVPWLAYNERLSANSAFNLAAWGKTNATVTQDTTVAPDGTTTADTLSDADAVNTGSVVQSFTVPNDSLTRLISIYFKAGTAVVCAITATLSGGAVVTASLAFKPSTGQFSGSNFGSNPPQVGITTLTGGWSRVTFAIVNNSSGNTTLQITINPAFAAALAGSGLGFTTNAAGATTGTVIAWLASSKDSFLPTYPPVGKNLAPELVATRDDSFTSSGIRQAAVQRVDQMQDYNFAWVPQADIANWTALMNNLLQGGVLTYFPDSTDLSTWVDYWCDDLSWKPKRVAFNMAGFPLKLRTVVPG